MSIADGDVQVKDVTERDDDVHDRDEEDKVAADQKDRGDRRDSDDDADANDNGKRDEGRGDRDQDQEQGDRNGGRGRGGGGYDGNDGGEGSTSLLVRNLSFNVRYEQTIS